MMPFPKRIGERGARERKAPGLAEKKKKRIKVRGIKKWEKL